MLRSLPHRRPWGVLLLIALLVLAGCGADTGETARRSELKPPQRPIADPDLRSLRKQANRLLDGGPRAFKARLAALRGHPVVVNQWASWCGPCRYEFPFFQQLSAKYEGRVAFLGVDSKDSRAEAAEFLRDFPVPYPHYFDPDTKVARVFEGGRSWPTTAFYAANGELVFTHFGAYRDEAQLEQQIRRYARP